MKKMEARTSSNPIRGLIILSIRSNARASQTCFAYKVREKAYAICITINHMVIQTIAFLNFPDCSSVFSAISNLIAMIR
jgi:hypothetical protein